MAILQDRRHFTIFVGVYGGRDFWVSQLEWLTVKRKTDESAVTSRRKRPEPMISRRHAVGRSGWAVLGLLSGSTLGGAQDRKSVPGLPKEMQERMEQSRAFAERMRDAGSMEERQQIMNEQMAWQRQRAVEDLKGQLGVSDQEWTVLKPRIQVVYDLVHPAPRPMGKSDAPRTETELRSRELRELLQDQKAPADQIKARLTALRAARERGVQQLVNARQGLRQLMTLRQEAVLVLNGLLD
jgi:hypothetical protein